MHQLLQLPRARRIPKTASCVSSRRGSSTELAGGEPRGGAFAAWRGRSKSGTHLSPLFALASRPLLRRAAAERLQASSPKKCQKGGRGAGGLMNFFRLGGGLGLESLRQLLGWSDSWRRCDGGRALHQKRTLFPRGLGAEAATMPSSSRMRCTPS